MEDGMERSRLVWKINHSIIIELGLTSIHIHTLISRATPLSFFVFCVNCYSVSRHWKLRIIRPVVVITQHLYIRKRNQFFQQFTTDQDDICCPEGTLSLNQNLMTDIYMKQFGKHN
jgi:hypothetical protein